jgi:hypothetical protein
MTLSIDPVAKYAPVGSKEQTSTQPVCCRVYFGVPLSVFQTETHS